MMKTLLSRLTLNQTLGLILFALGLGALVIGSRRHRRHAGAGPDCPD